MKLRTKRLVMRPFVRSDAPALVRALNNIRISRWMLVPYPYTRKDARAWITRCIQSATRREKKGYPFCIEHAATHTLIGGIGINSVDIYQGIGRIGYWLGEPYWRQGYGSEALKAIIDFAFQKLKLRRLEASVFVGNTASARLLEKYGFVYEGTLRQATRSRATGDIHDTLVYGLLRTRQRKRAR